LFAKNRVDVPAGHNGISTELVLVISLIGLAASLLGRLKTVLLRLIDVGERLVRDRSADKQLEVICDTVGGDGNYVEAEWHPGANSRG
jgi:hypothetical protein